MHPIDLVVLWVDGNDKEWQEEKAKFTAIGDDRIIRYRDWDLMRYWFRGVENCLPFIRKIHFVTWGHIPSWLNTDNEKLNIVKHSDFIPAEYLPTFNSNVIELNLHRIDDLSEHFILCNDDFFFLQEKSAEFFFKNGLPVDSAIQNVLQFHKSGGIGHITANNLELLNKEFSKREVMKKHFSKWFNVKYGLKAFYNLYLLSFSNFTGFIDPHLAYSHLKSSFAEMWELYPKEMEALSRTKIRTGEDINHWLIRYRNLAKGNFTPAKTNRGEFLIIGEDDEKIEKILSRRSVPMVCLSDDSENIDFEKEKKFLKSLFEKIHPKESSFER